MQIPMQTFEVPTYLEALGGKARLKADMPAVDIAPDRFLEAVKAILGEGGYALLLDITAIDWGVEADIRFTVVYHFYSLSTHTYLRLTVDCTANDAPTVPSIAHLYPGANWHERETFDMFGIIFTGHPNLKRILMWEGYPYHPLRKDFPLAGIEAPLPSAETAEATGECVIAAPMMGGPFHAAPGGTIANREPMGADQSWTECSPKPGPETPLN